MSSINLEEMIQLLRNCTEYAERFKLDVMTYLEEIFIEKNVAEMVTDAQFYDVVESAVLCMVYLQ